MHLWDLLGSIARVGHCIPFRDFYLVLHGLWQWINHNHHLMLSFITECETFLISVMSTFGELFQRKSLSKVVDRPKDGHVQTLYMKFYCRTLHHHWEIDVTKYLIGKSLILVTLNDCRSRHESKIHSQKCMTRGFVSRLPYSQQSHGSRQIRLKYLFIFVSFQISIYISFRNHTPPV